MNNKTLTKPTSKTEFSRLKLVLFSSFNKVLGLYKKRQLQIDDLTLLKTSIANQKICQ